MILSDYREEGTPRRTFEDWELTERVVMQKEQVREEDLKNLTSVKNRGKLIEEASKNSVSSASSIRGQCKAVDDPLFLFTEINSAFKKVRKGKKKKPTLLPNYDCYLDLDNEKLTSLGKYLKNPFNELLLYKTIYFREYKISPYFGYTIPKPKSHKRRTIYVPKPEDRVVFSALLEKTKKHFDFLKDLNILGMGSDSDSSKPEDYFIKILGDTKKHKFFFKIDIKDFFPSINKTILLRNLKHLGLKNEYYNLIESAIYNDVNLKNRKIDQKWFKSPRGEVGIPQGCAFSPLFANFYFSPIDRKLKQRKIVSYRYLDDMIVFIDKRQEYEESFKFIKNEIKKIRLTINESKTEFKECEKGLEYLGIEIYRGGFRIPNKAKIKLIDKSRSILDKYSDGIKYKDVIETLSSFLRGWSNFYGNCATSDYNKEIDKLNNDLTIMYMKKITREDKDKHMNYQENYLETLKDH